MFISRNKSKTSPGVCIGNGFCHLASRYIVKVLYCFLFPLVLIGCASLPETQTGSDVVKVNKSNILTILNQQYRAWRSVPYKMGGLSKRGVDCSGFVYLTYRDRLGMSLPRTTELQYVNSRKINKKDLQAGDLVFFQTGLKQKHVGIYLSDGQFLHASSSKGVMVSSLSNIYWNKKFLNARRL